MHDNAREVLESLFRGDAVPIHDFLCQKTADPAYCPTGEFLDACLAHEASLDEWCIDQVYEIFFLNSAAAQSHGALQRLIADGIEAGSWKAASFYALFGWWYDEGASFDVIFPLIERAAEENSLIAKCILGALFKNGFGVAQDKAKGIELYRQLAVEHNYAPAQFNLGCVYHDTAEGVEWFRRAAEQDLAVAQYYLGLAYAKGKGVAKDDVQAGHLFKLAAVQGYVVAQCSLGRWYRNYRNQSYVDAVKWFQIAADQNFAAAQCDLGLMHLDGRGVDESEYKALEFLYFAANQGYQPAKDHIKRIKGEHPAHGGDSRAPFFAVVEEEQEGEPSKLMPRIEAAVDEYMQKSWALSKHKNEMKEKIAGWEYLDDAALAEKLCELFHEPGAEWGKNKFHALVAWHVFNRYDGVGLKVKQRDIFAALPTLKIHEGDKGKGIRHHCNKQGDVTIPLLCEALRAEFPVLRHEAEPEAPAEGKKLG